ncbi:MAG: tyrosine-type recombinase/integrase [Lachnospiraceae bacterium]|nr:tyrosine-type recombinase/integrase [Lachnospiraceae bacterium]
MPDFAFQSNLGADIEAFILQKRAAGYPYLTSSMVLGYFDRMVAEVFPQSLILSKKICDTWIEECSKLHQNTLLRRVTPVRQLGKYLAGTGKTAYIIPGGIPHKQIRYDAHIFTETELKAFFASIDRCLKSSYAPYRCYVIPVIFRLLYTCGLRSSEARLLNVKDVDLTTGRILIRRSKGWEARMIYVSEDMLELLRRYDDIIGKYLSNREAFFPNQKGDYYHKSTLDVWFHEFWDRLPEASITKGNKPRVHDLRHSYCVYRLNQWVRENADLNALYPYLSEFVGHSNFADTDYYLTLAEPFYPEFEARMREVNTAILPEVPYED